LISALWVLTAPLHAQCTGENLIAALPAAEQVTLRAAAETAPYATGNFWRATKGAQVVTLVGTYHFTDSRHDAHLDALAPMLADATALLVEAGPEEEAAIKSYVAQHPEVMIDTSGPTLPERLSKPDWARLSDALRARGIPPFMAAKFRPWYLSMMLGIPACGMAEMADAKGLDALLIEAAEVAGKPVQALEPFDTVFTIFDGMTPEEQLVMVTSALAMEDRSADFAITLADAYFAEEGRLIWEFMRYESLLLPDYTPERVEAEFATMEAAMMTNRNRAWIPVITKAAETGPVLVAFGALHLSGQAGQVVVGQFEVGQVHGRCSRSICQPSCASRFSTPA